MRALIHCIYASTRTGEFQEERLPEFLEALRANNARLGVTGMLLYIDDSFFQVLEGSDETVDLLYETIRKDPRHTRVTQIIREPIPRRGFPDWTMGFSRLACAEAGELVGENDFFNDAASLSRLGGGRAKKLLNAFRDGRWRADRTGKFRTPVGVG